MIYRKTIIVYSFKDNFRNKFRNNFDIITQFSKKWVSKNIKRMLIILKTGLNR